MKTLRALFAHNDWARDRIMTCAASLTDAQLDRSFEIGPGSLRETLTRVRDERIGDLAVQGVVPRLSETPGKIHHLGRGIGEDNAEVYRDWLELDESDLATLKKNGVI